MLRWVAAFALVLMLSSCASPPKREIVVRDTEAISSVKTIAILTPGVTSRAAAHAMLSSGSALFGGPLVIMAAADTMKKRDEEFLRALNARQYDVRASLVKALVGKLKDQGLNVVFVEATHPNPGLLESYAQFSDVAADAYLDLYITEYGYIAEGNLSPYQPLLGIDFKLVRSADGRALLKETYLYTALTKDPSPLHKTPDTKYNMGSFEDVMSHLDFAVEGIERGVELGAATIANTLNP